MLLSRTLCLYDLKSDLDSLYASGSSFPWSCCQVYMYKKDSPGLVAKSLVFLQAIATAAMMKKHGMPLWKNMLLWWSLCIMTVMPRNPM